jgi:hypothetical protein
MKIFNMSVDVSLDHKPTVAVLHRAIENLALVWQQMPIQMVFSSIGWFTVFHRAWKWLLHCQVQNLFIAIGRSSSKESPKNKHYVLKCFHNWYQYFKYPHVMLIVFLGVQTTI